MLNIHRSRPLGITIIAVIMAIYGIFGIIGGITLMSVNLAWGVITVVLAILELVLARGLWTLQRWAYWTTVVLEILALLNSVFAFTHGTASGGIFSTLMALIILVYLFADRNVRLAFRT